MDLKMSSAKYQKYAVHGDRERVSMPGCLQGHVILSFVFVSSAACDDSLDVAINHQSADRMQVTEEITDALWGILLVMSPSLDSFTVPLHSPNDRHLPVVRAVQRDWGLKNGGNSHWSREPIMQWGTRQSQSIFRPTNYKRVMPVN